MLSSLAATPYRPAYQDDDLVLFHGESLAIMDTFPDGFIDLTITSPPYNIGKEYEIVRAIDEYVDWTAEWTKKVCRLTADHGSFWLNLGYTPISQQGKAVPLPYLIWGHVPFYFIQEIVWNYGAGVAGRLFFSPRNEKFLWFVKNPDRYTFNLDSVRDTNVKYPNQKKNGKLKCNPLGKNPTDVWQIPKVTSGANRASPERTAHPAQFPIALITRIALASSNEDAVLFDPFAGSGSVLETALRTGRKAIGIEKEKRYVDMAIDRIKRVRQELAAQDA